MDRDMERAIRDTLPEAYRYFTDSDEREQRADERAKTIAAAHLKGFELIARAITDGLRGIADAVREHR